MNAIEIMNYLRPVIELEKNKYIQEQVIMQINSQIREFEHEREGTLNYRHLRIINNSLVDKNNIQVSKKGRWIMFVAMYFMLFWSIGIDTLVYGITQNIILTIIIALIGIIISITVPILGWKRVLSKRRQTEIITIGIQEEADKHWQNQQEEKNKILDAKIKSAKNQEKIMSKTLYSTKSALQKCYSPNIIPKEYRSLVPVCMFYDYLSKGRTYTIRRNNADPGAVNIYEEDLKFQAIINKLDEINIKLNQIRKNQEILYETIESGNRKTHELLAGINNNVTNFRNEVNKNMDVIKYQNEQIAHNTEYMSYVAYQRYMSR